MTEQTVNSKVVNDILDHTKAYQGHYIQSIYKESLRSLINFFSNLYYQDGDGNNKPIKCYFGSQERSIAALFKENNLILPVITVTENSSQNSDDRRRYAPVLINEKYWDPKEQRAVRLISLSPRPVDVSYTISIWAEYKEDLDQIREAIFNQFNPSIELEIEKNYNTKIHIESEDDTSRVSVSDKEDRVLRKTINLLSETYIPSPKFLYTSTGKIERFNYEIELVQTPQIFDQAVADQARGTLTIEEIVGRQQIPTTVAGGTFTGSLATTNLTDVSSSTAGVNTSGEVLVWYGQIGKYLPQKLWAQYLTANAPPNSPEIVESTVQEQLTDIWNDLGTLTETVSNLNFDGPYVNTSGDTMTGPLIINNPSSIDSDPFVIQRGGVQKASITNLGNFIGNAFGYSDTSLRLVAGNNNTLIVNGTGSGFSPSLYIYETGTVRTFSLKNNFNFGWSPGVADSTPDTILQRLSAGSLALSAASGSLTINSTTANVPSILQLSSNITGNDVVGGKIDFNVTGGITYASIQAIQGASTGYGSLAFFARNAGVTSERFRLNADGTITINPASNQPVKFIPGGSYFDIDLSQRTNFTGDFKFTRNGGYYFLINAPYSIAWTRPLGYVGGPGEVDTIISRASSGVISVTSSIQALSAVIAPTLSGTYITSKTGFIEQDLLIGPNAPVRFWNGAAIRQGPLGTEIQFRSNIPHTAQIAIEANNVLSLRNGTSNQTFRLYNTYTDDSNYERAEIGFLSNVFRIGTYRAGTGSARHFDILTDGLERWRFANTGNLLAMSDNTYDIGTSVGNRPRNVYISSSITAPTISSTNNTASNMIVGSALLATTNSFLNYTQPYIWGYKTTQTTVSAVKGCYTEFMTLPFSSLFNGGGLLELEIQENSPRHTSSKFIIPMSYDDSNNSVIRRVLPISTQGRRYSSPSGYGSGEVALEFYKDASSNLLIFRLRSVGDTDQTGSLQTNILVKNFHGDVSFSNVTGIDTSNYNYSIYRLTPLTQNKSNVGINISEPSATLHVNGNVLVETSVTSKNSFILAPALVNSVTPPGDGFGLVLRNQTASPYIAGGLVSFRNIGLIFQDGQAYIGTTGGTYYTDFYQWNCLKTRSDFGIGWSNNTDAKSSPDLTLFRDAANTLAQRNSTNAQTFRIYNTYTDASNYERASLNWNASSFTIGTESLGTGLARPLILGTSGIPRISISSTGSVLVDLPTNQAFQIGATSNNHNGIYLWNFGTIRAMFNPYGLRFWDSASIEWGGQGSTAPAGGDTRIYRASPAVVQIASSLQVFSSTISPIVSATTYLNLSASIDNIYVNQSGDTMTGDLSGTNIYLTGTLAAATKSFLIDHPTKPNKKLQYACLEGPENSVYVRGKVTSNVIELPEYWTGLVHEDSISVNLTPIGFNQIVVDKIEDNKVYLLSTSNSINAFYIVYATRKDVPELEVEF